MLDVGGNNSSLLGTGEAGVGAPCPTVSRGLEECWLQTRESAGGNTRNDKRFMKWGL